MKSAINREQEQAEDNVVMFTPEVIIGGKEPPTGDSNIWLDNIPIGGCFWFKNNDQFAFLLKLGRVADRKGKATVINIMGEPTVSYVDPAAFSRMFRLFENLGILGPKEEEIGGPVDEPHRLQPVGGEANPTVE